MSADNSLDDKVGYKKPPSAGQFKKGQSGNPRGRRKGSFSAKSDFEKAMRRMVTLRIDEKSERTTALKAIFVNLTFKALRGDLKAIEAVLKLAKELELLSPSSTATGPDNSSPSPFTWTEEHESMRPFIEHLLNGDKPVIDE